MGQQSQRIQTCIHSMQTPLHRLTTAAGGPLPLLHGAGYRNEPFSTSSSTEGGRNLLRFGDLGYERLRLGGPAGLGLVVSSVGLAVWGAPRLRLTVRAVHFKTCRVWNGRFSCKVSLHNMLLFFFVYPWLMHR